MKLNETTSVLGISFRYNVIAKVASPCADLLARRRVDEAPILGSNPTEYKSAEVNIIENV